MFSKDSRWDRHTPDQSQQRDPIDVAAVFEKGKAFPRTFVWQNRKYQIKEVTYHWVENRGGEILHFYTVTDGSNLYQIYLNTKHLYWRLDKVCPLE